MAQESLSALRRSIIPEALRGKIWRAIGLNLLSQGRFDDAVQAYHQATNVMSRSDLTRAIDQVESEKSTFAGIARAAYKEQNDVEVLMLKAEQHSRYHQYDECVRTCRQVNSIRPRHFEAQLLEADSHFRMAAETGNRDYVWTALRLAGRLRAQNSEDPSISWFYSLCAMAWGVPEEELEAWRDFLPRAQDGEPSRREFAEGRERLLGGLPDSLDRPSIQFGGHSAGLHSALLQVQQWEHETAIGSLGKLSTSDSTIAADAHFILGYLAYLRRDDLGVAIAHYESARAAVPSYPEAERNARILDRYRRRQVEQAD